MSKILALRSEAGITQEQLADAVGCDRSTVSNYERGMHGIRHLITFKRLAIALGCSLDDLLPDQLTNE